MTEYVQVPREPTPEMIAAGRNHDDLCDRANVSRIYAAMLAAAPEAQVAPQGGGEVLAMLRECYEWLFESKADGPRVSEGAIVRGYYTPDFLDLHQRLCGVIASGTQPAGTLSGRVEQAATPEAQVAPLVWRKIEGGEHYVATTPWRCDYWINQTAGGWAASFADYARVPWYAHGKTLLEAQGICQNHHAQQIASLFVAASLGAKEPARG